MKTIYKGKDDLYYAVTVKAEDGQLVLPSELHALTMDFYTSGENKVTFSKDDLTAEGILYINADDLSELPDGPLKARFHISLTDSNFTDGKYDQVAERLTGYFLKTLHN